LSPSAPLPTCLVSLDPFCTFLFFYCSACPRDLHSFPTRRSSDLGVRRRATFEPRVRYRRELLAELVGEARLADSRLAEEQHVLRSEEHTSELQSPDHLVCRLLLEKKKKYKRSIRLSLSERTKKLQ